MAMLQEALFFKVLPWTLWLKYTNLRDKCLWKEQSTELPTPLSYMTLLQLYKGQQTSN